MFVVTFAVAAPSPRGEDTAPAPAAPGVGISGPGAIHGPRWFQYNSEVTGSAVKAGLIPNIKPLIPDTQLRATVIIVVGGGTNHFQDKKGRWWCAFFGNDDQASFREKPAMVMIEFDRQGLIHAARDQPAFVLEPTH